jgi:hypothetical protein
LIYFQKTTSRLSFCARTHVALSTPLVACKKRYDDLVASLPLGLLPEMNVLLIDAQGMEFEILSGMTTALAAGGGPGSGGGGGFEAAVVEVSHVSVYEVSCCVRKLGFPRSCAHHPCLSLFFFTRLLFLSCGPQGQHLGPDVDALMLSLGFRCEAHCEPCEHCDRLYFRA